MMAMGGLDVKVCLRVHPLTGQCSHEREKNNRRTIDRDVSWTQRSSREEEGSTARVSVCVCVRVRE